MNTMKALFLITGLMISLFGNAQDKQVADTADYLSSVKKELTAVWPNNRTINLVFHGHSVVAGYQANHEVHTFESYPFLLLKKLKEKYPYAVINVIVTAIGGENSVRGQERFKEDVLVHKPDVLFIDYALNDIGAGLEKSGKSWEKMIRDALKRNIKIILLTPSPDQRIDMLAKDNALELHADQIRKLAGKYHIGLADSYLLFQNMEKEGKNIKDYMSQVNHPNQAGNEMIADELMKWFD